MLVFLDEQARRVADECWHQALEELLALVQHLSRSEEAARRFALSASPAEIRDYMTWLEEDCRWNARRQRRRAA